MNKAFVKDDDGAGLGEALPDHDIPPHPNLVTADGLAQIDDMLAQAISAFAAAHEAVDRDAKARAARDQRYWTSRRSTVQLVTLPTDIDHVKFGARVTISRDDGRRQTFRIVGLDEADPARGTLSYVSPMAQALIGHAMGDVVHVGGGEVVIVEIG